MPPPAPDNAPALHQEHDPRESPKLAPPNSAPALRQPTRPRFAKKTSEDHDLSSGESPAQEVPWEALCTKHQKAIGAKAVERLAGIWGVSAAALRRLGIGFDAGAYTFPMRNARGEIIGIRRRAYDDPKEKYAVTGSAGGLFVPAAKIPSLKSSRCLQASSWPSAGTSSDNAPARGQGVLGLRPGGVEIVTESESDLAAALTLGVPGIGHPGAHVTTAEVVAFFQGCLTACPCIVADNDAEGQGEKGAEDLADALAAAGVPCRVLTPPCEFKDLRAWLRGGVTAEALRKAIDRQPIRWPDDDPPGFVQVPNRLLRRVAFAGISPGAFKLACTIQAFYSPGRKPFPPREELAKLLGVHPGTIDHWKRELERAGIMKWTRGRTGRANEYQVNFGPVRGSKKRQEAGAAQGVGAPGRRYSTP